MAGRAIKRGLIITFLWVVCSAWTVALLEKPGGELLERGYSQLETGNLSVAAGSFAAAYREALDHKTQRQALEELAKIYLAGAVEGDPVPLLEEAVRLGSNRAPLVLGEMYREGQGVPKDTDKAIRYYEMVAPLSAKASFALAELLPSQRYFEQTLQLMRTEETPPISMMLKLARYYRDGNAFTAQDPAQAEYWYRRAIGHGNDTAALELAALWNEQAERPFADVAELWRQAADIGNVKAMVRLGIAYDLGWGGLHRPDEAEVLLANAVTADPGKAYKIARRYETVLEHDESYLPKMLYWYGVAADYGHAVALLKLARRYWRGEGVREDREKARTLFREAALAGNGKALPELAEYERRAGKKRQHSPQDYADWLAQAERGVVEAMRETGRALLYGRGVARDPKQGVRWLRRAADAGDVPAMLALARATIAGVGAEMDVAAAYRLYARAAQAGNGEAQYQLGMGYARGIGLPQDDALARKWLSRARAQGYILAEEIYQGFRDNDGG